MNIKIFGYHIYSKCNYNIDIIDSKEENTWWCKDKNIWTNPILHIGNLSSHRPFKTGKDAFKEFNKLTRLNIKARLSYRVFIMNRPIYSVEYLTENQERFKIEDK